MQSQPHKGWRFLFLCEEKVPALRTYEVAQFPVELKQKPSRNENPDVLPASLKAQDSSKNALVDDFARTYIHENNY
jgi:hypothetical protein